jgi:hypothetical protein
VQLAPALSVLPQVLLWANAVGFVPASAMPVMASVPLPVFVSVTVWAELDVPTDCVANEKLLVLRIAAGVATPVPPKLTLCGLPGALSVTVTLAPSAVATRGTKVTERVQLAPALRLLQQLVVSAKWCGLAPPITMLLMVIAAFPVFVKVTVLAALVEFTD